MIRFIQERFFAEDNSTKINSVD